MLKLNDIEHYAVLIALSTLLLHLPVIVVLHPGIVKNSGPGGHSNGDLLLLAAEQGNSGAAVDAGAGSVVKGAHSQQFDKQRDLGVAGFSV